MVFLIQFYSLEGLKNLTDHVLCHWITCVFIYSPDESDCPRLNKAALEDSSEQTRSLHDNHGYGPPKLPMCI